MAIYLLPFGIIASLAVLYKFNILKLSRVFYALALLVLALFAGLRFEVGQDWEAYEALFDRLDLSDNIIDLYSSGYQQFEVGYYALNYAVKALGGTYSTVFVIISLFLAYAFYIFTKRFAINRFYVLTIYAGYSFMLLNFAQVRQAIAISFFILGCDYYLCHQKKARSLAIASIGILFQYTSIMYPVLLAIVMFWPKKNQTLWTVTLLVIMTALLYIVSLFTDFYSIVTLISISSSAAEKVSIYKENQNIQGIGQVIFAGYLMGMVFYFRSYTQSIRPERAFIIRYAIASLLITVLFVVIFPGTYAFYSRIYVVASIFQAYAAALIFASHKRRPLHTVVFMVTLLASASYFYRLMSSYEDEYLPYKTVISLPLPSKYQHLPFTTRYGVGAARSGYPTWS